MEFLDEDTRPRFLFQSRPQPSSSLDKYENHIHQKPTKLFLIICFSISSLLIFVAFFFFQIEPFQSLLLWLSLSLLVGPFAPSHLTGGQTRVGCGPIVETPVQDLAIEPEEKKRPQKNRSSANKSPNFHAVENSNGSSRIVSNGKKVEVLESTENLIGKNEEVKEWNEEDIEILKKQVVKNPVGKPKRWEVIAEAFNGRHRVESVIKKVKELGEKKNDDSDSYAQFLKNRKAVDVRVEEKCEEESKKENVGGGGWCAGEDISLLNALKAFPKDVPMRWEKIAAAVSGTGRSKAACMKRVSDLKRGFRSSKAGAGADY